MAGSVNKVILVGNLGKDPETRTFSNGGEKVEFSIATSETWTKDGQRNEKTEWHNVAIFNDRLAKVAKQYLRKGTKVYVEGQLQTRKWQDQNGNDRYTTEVVLQQFRGELQILSARGEDGGSGRSNDDWGGGGRASGGYGGNERGNGGNSRSPSPFNDDLDDDVPF